MENFFNSEEPYIRARNITNNHELTGDLVSFVYLMMFDSKKEIKNVAAMFTKLAYNQWNWSGSEFHKEQGTFNETYSHDDLDYLKCEFSDNEETDRQRFLRDYLEQESSDVVEWYKKEIAKLILQGMTYREIQKNTKINLRYLSETIKQFIEDVHSDFYRSSLKHGGTDSTTTEH